MLKLSKIFTEIEIWIMSNDRNSHNRCSLISVSFVECGIGSCNCCTGLAFVVSQLISLHYNKFASPVYFDLNPHFFGWLTRHNDVSDILITQLLHKPKLKKYSYKEKVGWLINTIVHNIGGALTSSSYHSAMAS